MLRFFARWIFRAAFLAVAGAGFISPGGFGAVIAWAIFGYLLWRAFPAVRKDIRALWQIGRHGSVLRNARF